MRRRARTPSVTRPLRRGSQSSSRERYCCSMKLRFVVLSLAMLVAEAAAQSPTTGAIQGKVVERKSKEGMAGIVVTITGPNLIEPQTAITDEDGRYKISELPPGTYR